MGTTKTPRPVTPKALPKWLRAELEKADMRGVDYVLTGPSVRAILAALAHERRNRDDVLEEAAKRLDAAAKAARNRAENNAEDDEDRDNFLLQSIRAEADAVLVRNLKGAP